MANFRFNLDKTFRSKEASDEAKRLIRLRKKVLPSLYNDKETSIYLSISYNGEYLKHNTGLKIKPVNFDVKTQSIKTRDTKSIQFQLLLSSIKDSCDESYRELLLKKKPISESVINKLIQNSINPPVEKVELTFLQLYAKFYEWKVKTVNIRTLPRYNVLKKELLKFEKKRRIPLNIHVIDKKFSEEFALFLIDDLNITHNTIRKYLISLKCFLNFCLENELTINIKFKQIKATEIQTSIFVLEEFEIDNIINLEIENKSLKEVRDSFIWLYLTAQRFSDIKTLKKEDIIEKNGRLFWRLFQYKTRATTSIDIPLLPKAEELFKERMEALNNKDFVFNVISNQKMNSQLKVIGKLAKLEGVFTLKRLQGKNIKEITQERSNMISTHTGRRSMITNMIKRGMPETAIIKISGHSELSALKPYVELSETYIAKTLFECFDVKSEGNDSQ